MCNGVHIHIHDCLCKCTKVHYNLYLTILSPKFLGGGTQLKGVGLIMVRGYHSSGLGYCGFLFSNNYLTLYCYVVYLLFEGMLLY